MYWTPGPDSSNLIKTEKAVPNNPLNNAKIRYKVPISFALLDKNQRSHHMEILPSLVSITGLDTAYSPSISSLTNWLVKSLLTGEK